MDRGFLMGLPRGGGGGEDCGTLYTRYKSTKIPQITLKIKKKTQKCFERLDHDLIPKNNLNIPYTRF